MEVNLPGKVTDTVTMQKNGSNKKEDFKSMKAFGIGERNDGDRLMEFADDTN